MLAAMTAVGVGVPALADTAVVGYLPPGVDYGTADDSEVELGEVRAQGVVVEGLEPGARDLGTRAACPPEGCRYALVVVDPAALRGGTGTHAGVVGCDVHEYGVIDPEPDEVALGSGARLYTAFGPLPTHTTVTAGETTSRPLRAGVGLLCFATTSGDEDLSNDAGGGPLAATQPKPVVIFHDPDAAPGR